MPSLPPTLFPSMPPVNALAELLSLQKVRRGDGPWHYVPELGEIGRYRIALFGYELLRGQFVGDAEMRH